jgi:hypothetical protein
MRVVNACGKARFVEEHFDEFRLSREVGMKPFDGDKPLKTGSSDEAREEDGRHPAGR